MIDIALIKTVVPGAIGTVIAVVSTVVAIIQKYEKDIAIVTLAIEKANEDGVVTPEEKKEIANKVYFECIQPELKGKWFLLRLIPKSWITRWINKIVDKICNRAKGLMLNKEQLNSLKEGVIQ